MEDYATFARSGQTTKGAILDMSRMCEERTGTVRGICLVRSYEDQTKTQADNISCQPSTKPELVAQRALHPPITVIFSRIYYRSRAGVPVSRVADETQWRVDTRQASSDAIW